ncbi:MAG: hypothetical protein OXG51_10620 [Gammaproteobacteria bacterium]|nr:hypothetical protein [Gammaproteobacteria bacterium]
MKILLPIAAAAVLWPALSHACDDHVGKCKIEAWRYTHTPAIRLLTIEGSASCNEGTVNMRLYVGDGEKKKFLGTADGIIEGHALKAVAYAIYEKPKTLSIRYSIKPQ